MGLLECSYSPWVFLFLIHKLGCKIVMVVSDRGGGCLFFLRGDKWIISFKIQSCGLGIYVRANVF